MPHMIKTAEIGKEAVTEMGKLVQGGENNVIIDLIQRTVIYEEGKK